MTKPTLHSKLKAKIIPFFAPYHFDSPPQRILKLFLGICTLVIVLGQAANARQQVDVGSAENLWHTENLPQHALWRYGATDRNPNAIGIFDLRFSHDGTMLAARDRRQNIRILNLETETLELVLMTSSVKDFVFSPNDEFIVVGNRKKTQLWSLADGEVKRDIPGPGYKLAANADKPSLYVGGKGSLTRYDWPLPSQGKTVQASVTNQFILPIGISDSGQKIAFRISNSHKGKVEVLDFAGHSMSMAPARSPRVVRISSNHRMIADMNFGAREMYVSALNDPERYQWKLSDDRHFVTATFSNDNRFLFTSNYDNDIVIWDMVTMNQAHRLRGHSARVSAIVSADEPFCLASGASGSTDRSVIFWNFKDLIFPQLPADSKFEFEAVWEQLGSDDAKASLDATNQLYYQFVNDPNSLSATRRKLHLYSNETNELVVRLFKNLDDRAFEVREKATEELMTMSGQIRPMLEAKVRSGSQEAKWRIRKILSTDKGKPAIASPAGRRMHRVVMALEMAGNEGAIAMLKLSAESYSRPELAEAARDALLRLGVDQSAQN